MVAQKGKENKRDTKERKSYRLTERRVEWIYFLASDIPYILPSLGLRWEHRWAFICPTRRLLHLFACGRDRQRRGL